MRDVKTKCPLCNNPLMGQRSYGSLCIYYVCSECNAIFDYKMISDDERTRRDGLMFEKKVSEIVYSKSRKKKKVQREKLLYVYAEK